MVKDKIIVEKEFENLLKKVNQLIKKISVLQHSLKHLEQRLDRMDRHFKTEITNLKYMM